MDEGRERLELTQASQDYNKQLTFVSIVGEKGVGKSKIASLLSGNSSMFESSDQSHGVDMSPIIPSTNYSDVLGDKLQTVLEKTGEVLPIFLIDSEGTGAARSVEDYDFMTTTSIAIVAKVRKFI